MAQADDRQPAPEHGKSEAVSFRDRVAARLAEERGDAPREAGDRPPKAAESDHQRAARAEGKPPADDRRAPPDDPDLEALEYDAEDAEDEDQGDDDVEFAAEGDADQEPVEASADDDEPDELRALLEGIDDSGVRKDVEKLIKDTRAQELKWRQTMTRKTQEAAEIKAAALKQQQELEVQAQDQEMIAQWNLGDAHRQVQYFESQIDWGHLRASDPERAKQAEQAYTYARQQRDRLQQAHTQLVERNRAQIEQRKRIEAGHARDVLMTIPEFVGRGGEFNTRYFGEMRRFAVDKLGYTPEEFDDLTDARHLKGIAVQMQLATAPKEIRRLKKQRKSPPTARQREKRQTSQPRSKSGKFQSERQAFRETGDRTHLRKAFMARIAAERGE